ncbi:MAG: hypothetical protein ABFS56_18585 [Pseudomonadota bacterium]
MKKIIFSVCVIMVGWGEMAVAGHGPFYNVGNNAGVGLAESAWDNLGRSCREIQIFAQIVEDGVRDAARDIETKYRGRSAKDFGAGYQDGLLSVLNRVRNRCGNARTLLERLERLVLKLFKVIIAGGSHQEKHQKPYNDYRWFQKPSDDYRRFQKPSDDYRRPYQSYYSIGYNAGSGLARSIWDSLGQDCRMTRQFVRIVRYSVDDAIAGIGRRYRGWAAEQFGQGYVDGLVDVLKRQVSPMCD